VRDSLYIVPKSQPDNSRLMLIHNAALLPAGTACAIRLFTRLMLAILLILVAACAGVPFDYPKTPSQAIAISPATAAGEIALEWRQRHGKLSGFVALSDGIDGLGARLKLMEAAQRSIDAQYFIIKKDDAGRLFVGKMLRAADRGVRVRLLVDDIFSPGADQSFTLMDSHPNIEVRLFNPLTRQSFRYWSYLVDFNRANRRMHNKSFTVDNAMTIVGGRNIGAEYFELNQDAKFDDFEVLALGPVVEQVSAGFDEFWNSELSVPVAAFNISVDPAELDTWRAKIAAELDRGSAGIYGRAVNSPVLADLREHRLEPIAARATLVSDSPEKLQSAVGDAQLATLARETGRRFRAATREIIIITPYFIPLATGSELVEELLGKGIRVVIVTNSLASTNHVPVYSHYTRYRKRLLRAGAEFYEIRAERPGKNNAWGHRPDLATLHSKVTIIDRATIFVGSLNFDPRSLLINSEMGLFIESQPAAHKLTETLAEEIPRVTYKVDLDEQGELRWTYQFGDQHEVLTKSPQTTFGRRFTAGFYRLLPLEKQL
jgi:cardiolipin synthase C